MSLWRLLFGRETPASLVDEAAENAKLRNHVIQGDIQSLEVAINRRRAGVNAVIDDYGKTALHYAVYYGRLQMVKWLIKEGADTNRKDINEQVPLHTVYLDGQFDKDNSRVTEERRECIRRSIVSILLQSGADPNIEDDRGATPLLYALLQHSFSTMRTLLENGATLTSTDLEGLTPLHTAAELGTLDWALECYGDLDAQDDNGNTLLHKVMQPEEISYFPSIIKAIIRRGATVDIRNKNQQSPYDVCLMQYLHYRENQKTQRCVTVIMYTLQAHVINKDTLVKHIVKLKTAGIPVNDDISAEFDVGNDSIQDELQQLQADCREELKKLAEIPVHGRITLGHVFTKFLSPHYLADQKIVEIFEDLLNVLHLKRHLPIYEHILKQAFEKSKKRYDLMTRASRSLMDEKRPETLRSLARNQLAVECLLEYLSERDLENLIKSV